MKRCAFGIGIIGLFVLGACGGADAVPPSTTAAPTSATQLTVEQARKIALAEVPGTIVEEEYEQEGPGWVYGFEIRPADGSGVKEVEIDAHSGKVLEVEDGDDDDDDEDGDGDEDEDGDGDGD